MMIFGAALAMFGLAGLFFTVTVMFDGKWTIRMGKVFGVGLLIMILFWNH